MKPILGLSLALVLMSPAAMAQQAPSPPAPPASQDSARPAPPPAPQAGRDQDDDEADGDAMRGGRWHQHRPPPPMKSARFRVEAGDVSLGMTCPSDEPLKNCQDFALQLLDKAGSIANRH